MLAVVSVMIVFNGVKANRVSSTVQAGLPREQFLVVGATFVLIGAYVAVSRASVSWSRPLSI